MIELYLHIKFPLLVLEFLLLCCEFLFSWIVDVVVAELEGRVEKVIVEDIASKGEESFIENIISEEKEVFVEEGICWRHNIKVKDVTPIVEETLINELLISVIYIYI